MTRMTREDLVLEALKKLEGSWSTDPEDLKAEIQESVSEHNAECEFWFEYSGAILLTDEDGSVDTEMPFEIRKAGACTYILEFML